MSNDFTQAEIDLAKERLGITSQQLLFAFQAGQLSIVEERLHAILESARKAFRSWLPRLHPDRQPNRPEFHREFLVLSWVWSLLKNMKDPVVVKSHWLAVQEKQRKNANPMRAMPSFATTNFNHEDYLKRFPWGT